MKSKFLLFLILSSSYLVSYSQVDTLITYEQVNYIDSTTKNDLYDRGKLWVVNNFKDSKSVIQLDNKESGQILCKGNFETFFTMNNLGVKRIVQGRTDFTMNLLIKDGKYKVKIYDLSFKSYENTNGLGETITSASDCPVKWPMNGQGKMNKMWDELKGNIDTKCKSFLSNLKESMQSKNTDTDF